MIMKEVKKMELSELIKNVETTVEAKIEAQSSDYSEALKAIEDGVI
jgi:hypothetical protein